MVVNYRNRLQGVSADLVGNYWETLGFPKDVITQGAAAIRQALEDSKQPCRRPSILQTLGMRFGLVTSWASFHYDVKLDGCEIGEHFPVFDLMGVPKNTVVIYRPKTGSLAAMVIAGEKAHEAFRKHKGFQESRLGLVETYDIRGNVNVVAEKTYFEASKEQHESIQEHNVEGEKTYGVRKQR